MATGKEDEVDFELIRDIADMAAEEAGHSEEAVNRTVGNIIFMLEELKTKRGDNAVRAAIARLKYCLPESK